MSVKQQSCTFINMYMASNKVCSFVGPNLIVGRIVKYSIFWSQSLKGVILIFFGNKNNPRTTFRKRGCPRDMQTLHPSFFTLHTPVWNGRSPFCCFSRLRRNNEFGNTFNIINKFSLTVSSFNSEIMRENQKKSELGNTRGLYYFSNFTGKNWSCDQKLKKNNW